MTIYRQVTGMISIPSGERDKAEPALEQMYHVHGDNLAEYLRPFWEAWTQRKTRDGRKYSRSNLSWLYDWAIAGEIPTTSKPAPTNDTYAALDAAFAEM